MEVMGIQDAEYWKKYREANKEKLKAARQARYKANPEKFIKRSLEFAKNNRPKIRSYHKKWRDANPDKTKQHYENFMANHGEELYERRRQPEVKEKIYAANKEWRENNKEKVRAAMKAWHQAHKNDPKYKSDVKANVKRHYWKDPERSRLMSSIRNKRRRPAANESLRKRRLTDIQFMLADRMRANLGRALRRNWIRKSKRTMEMVGCSVEDLKIHLEKQFTDGLSWENRHEWHCDHFVPIAAFDLTDEEEMKWAFNFRNLQPLRCFDNHQKSDTLPNPLPDWLPAHIAQRILQRATAAPSTLPPLGQSTG